MKEACSNRGAPLKKDDLIISTDGSKAGDKNFYEAAMKEYNKEKHDEYDALHFADDIVVDDKNIPKVFNPIKNWRDLKKVFNETTAELDTIRQLSMLSGRNGSDSEGETDGKHCHHPQKVKDIHSILEPLCQPRPRALPQVEPRATRRRLLPVGDQEKDWRCNPQEEKEWPR
jgi:hypothetical protein